jgi:SAM-dependent methyltransferase
LRAFFDVFMNSRTDESISDPGWASGRGEKWRANLAGMEATLQAVDEPLISALRLDRPCRIAEAGCGGGGTTLEILRRAPKGSVVHGFDLSPALIEQAGSRVSSQDSAIAFKVADMAAAPPPGPPYQRLVSRFGIMFFDDPSSAFANLFRWLAPGGRCAFAVWGPLSENPWMQITSEAVAGIIPLPAVDSEGPGAFRYADAAKLLKLLGDAGFGDLEVHSWRGALPIGGGLPAAEAANFALASFSSFSELLAKSGAQAADQARQALTALYAGHLSEGVVQMNATVHIITGARP